MRLFKKINTKEVKEDGKTITKHYTNFYLEVEMEGQKKKIAIQPVNFGKDQNRKNYNVLSMCSELLKDEENPFE